MNTNVATNYPKKNNTFNTYKTIFICSHYNVKHYGGFFRGGDEKIITILVDYDFYNNIKIIIA